MILISIGLKSIWRAVYKRSNHFDHTLKKVLVGDDQQPIIMVLGDELPLFFAEKYYLESPEGYFFRIDEIAELSRVIQAVTQLNAQWSERIQLIHLLIPEFHTQTEKMRTDIKSLRWHIDKVRKQLGFMPNLMVVAYFNEHHQPNTYGSSDKKPWFCEFQSTSHAINHGMSELECSAYSEDRELIIHDHAKYNSTEWLNCADSSESKLSRFSYVILAQAARDFLYQNVLSEYWTDARIAPPIFPVNLSIHFTHVLPISRNVWAKYLEKLTGLNVSKNYKCSLHAQVSTEPQFFVNTSSNTFTSDKEHTSMRPIQNQDIYEVERLPFPDAILKLLPKSKRLKRYENMIYSLTSTGMIFFTCLMTFSYHYNQELISSIGNHLVSYQGITEAEYINKQNAFLLLKDDLERLEHYYRVGPPNKYQAGLYQGEKLYPHLFATITTAIDEQRVKTEMEQLSSQQLPKQQRLLESLSQEEFIQEEFLPSKELTYLDSISLFDVGESKLKPAATNSLIRALAEIEIHKDYVIFITGHTDNTGNEKQNEMLSLKRAEAVRDWMMEANKLPINCFAVQGLGASQPIASNNTDSGRQQNRRVEISLMPELAGCQS